MHDRSHVRIVELKTMYQSAVDQRSIGCPGTLRATENARGPTRQIAGECAQGFTCR
jgi:hypothetical protein